MSEQRDGADRRVAFTVGSRVRQFLMGIWVLSVLVILLFGALAVLIVVSKPDEATGPISTALFVGIGVTSFLLVSAALGLSVYATTHIHRVAGAAHQICRRIRDLQDQPHEAGRGGELVRLRPGDYLHDVATELNRLGQRLASGSAPGAEVADEKAAEG